jgi:UDP-N-acetyl-2-amino-2-deoxyglucuronate dehydrogenase
VPVRLGLVGLGNVGLGHHLPAFESLPELVRVAAVADPAPDRRAAAAERLGLGEEATYASPEALIADADVDVIDLATPPSIRVALARRAVAAGRAVVCEKPLAIAPADADALVGAAADAGVPVAMIHNYLHLPEIVAARAAIADGAIGRPEIAIVNALGVEDRPGSGAWRPGWRHDATVSGGGVLMDMLHLVYIAEALVGAPFRRVSAEILARTHQAPVEDVALCRYEADGSIALVNVGWGVGPGGMTVSGPLGRVEIAYADGGTGPFAPLASVRSIARDGTIENRTPTLSDPPGAINVRLLETFREVISGLIDGRPAGATAEDGARALDATLAAYVSAATAQSVDLPLPADHPVRLRGIAGLAELAIATGSTISRRGVFGVGGAER